MNFLNIVTRSVLAIVSLAGIWMLLNAQPGGSSIPTFRLNLTSIAAANIGVSSNG